MAEPQIEKKRGIRALLDDARRATFVLGLVIAVGTAVWAGTYWGWWAYVWDIALPVRIVGILSVSASAFVLWYALLFTLHYYFDWPKANPLLPTKPDSGQVAGEPALPVRITGTVENAVCKILLQNQGGTDTFVVQLSAVLGHHPEGWDTPKSVRWSSSPTEEKREVVAGQRQWLEVLQVEYRRVDDLNPGDKFRIQAVSLLTPSGPLRLPYTWDSHEKILEPMHIWIDVISVATGADCTFDCYLMAATTGESEPVIHWVVRRRS